jgi:hypothetical protein
MKLTSKQVADLRRTAARELSTGSMKVPDNAGGKVSRKRHKDTIPTAVRGPQRKPVPKLSLFNEA